MKKILALLVVLFFASCGDDGGTTPPTTTPTEPVAVAYDDCIGTETETTLEVVTWNIENFPQLAATVDAVVEIIEQMDPDVIALQELTSVSDFNDLVTKLNGWTGTIVSFNGSNQMLGYLYKSSEVSVTQNAINLYAEQTDENDDAFTGFRRPLLTTITHTNGLEVNLINIHMKCCNGSEDRRRAGSTKIKEYIDANLATDNVVVLGDFNDEIADQTDNVFQNFIDDADNYRFATMEIANGPTSEWSFPSWPSQIDQILITNELFDNTIETQTIKLDNCNSLYSNQISDHRPVVIRFNN